jgi:uncharacterized membrane protein YdjX (TVP38/TMEM64 family)
VWVRRIGIAALVLGLGYLAISIWDRDALVRWMSEASPVRFFVAMAVLPALGLPLSPFMIVAGATFGVWVALIGSLLAIAISNCIAYAIAHSGLRPRIMRLFERFDAKVPDYTEGGRAAWRFSAAIKLTPALPTFAKMYVLALTAVPFAIYFTVSVAITGAFAAAFIVLGDSLFKHDVSHATLALVALVAIAVVAVVWWRKRRVTDAARSAG